ncbi:MAG: phosphoserine phosphatase SerB [Candidatus Nanopelagicus sp.]
MPEGNMSTFTGLILVSGQDKPGITQHLMKVLSEFVVKIIDIEQIVIRDRLLLTVLISLDQGHAEAVVEDLNELQATLGLDIAIDFAYHNEKLQELDHLRVVIVGKEIKPSAIAIIATEIAKLGGNIEDIYRTSSAPVMAVELVLSLQNDAIKKVQSALAKVAVENGIDLAVELGGSARNLKRLVLLDMDSTLIEQEVIDLLAEYSGKSQIISDITAKAMSGELDFKQALSARVELLAGLDESVIDQVRQKVTLTKGAQQLITELHNLGHKVGVVSGGFIDVIEPILKDLEIDFYKANKLDIRDGKLTGNVVGKVIDGSEKLAVLREFASKEGINIQQTVAIGDGANDLEMIQAAGLGIAFNAKPKVAQSADTTLNIKDLSAVLLLMGINS